MAFCPNCGSQVQGAFCPNCGTSMSGAAPNPGPTPGAYVPPTTSTAASSGLEPHIASALCYTPFLIGLVASIIFLVAAPYNQNKFVRFSAFQSLFLHLAILILGIVLNILFAIAFAIIHLFAALLFPLSLLLWLGILGLFLYLMYKSFNNQKVVLPVIGDLAEKQA
jgi:uncharacterized membrane protein